MSGHSSRQPAARASGQAMVPVLLVVLILTALAVALTATSKREAREAATSVRDAQAYFALRGAINYAAAELQAATTDGATQPELTTPVDTDSNGWTQMGDAWYRMEIVDTASRLNLNLATVAQLILLPALSQDYSTALAIVDWRDADDQEGTQNGYTGAESAYYQALAAPYDAKNAPFDTLDELLLVRDMTTQRLYGPGGASSSLAQSITPATSRQTATAYDPVVDPSSSALPLSELLTTTSHELNVAADGTARINVQTASASAIATGLGISQQLAQRIVTSRNNTPLTSIGGLMSVQGITVAVMQQIADKVKVSDAQYRDGVVNLNTAPVEVLRAVPGIDQTVCDTIMAARESGTVFSGMQDIFALSGLSRQQFTAFINNVCTKSSTYLVRVRVRLQGSPRIYAAEALIDVQPPAAATSDTSSTGSTATTTTPSATILQWRPINRRFGWETWTSTVTEAGSILL